MQLAANFRRVAVPWAAWAAFLFFQPTAEAALTAFAAKFPDEDRMATVELISRQGVAYVSLPRLVDQFHGGFNVLPTRMKIDFMGATAWVQVNDNRVKAMNVFSLRHPVLRLDDDILIAQMDVAPFFEKAFHVTVQSADRPQTPVLVANPPAIRPGLLEPAVARPRPGERARPGEWARFVPLAPSATSPVDVIIIDAGHGGYDVGVEGRGGYQEKTLTLALALKLEAILASSLSQMVILTRRDDRDLTLSQRALLANKGQGGLLLSLHAGGAFSSSANGAALFYPPPTLPDAQIERPAGLAPYSDVLPVDYSIQSGAVAYAIGETLVRTTSAALRGIQEAPCRLFGLVAMPGVLIEVGCLTNPSEEALLEMDSYQTKMAEGIAAGLAAYLENRRGGVASSPGRNPSPQ